MASVLGLRRSEPKLNPKKPWRPNPRVTPQPLTAGHSAYLGVRALLPPSVVMGYGIDHKGPWARVGDSRCRRPTPDEALETAYAMHIEGTSK